MKRTSNQLPSSSQRSVNASAPSRPAAPTSQPASQGNQNLLSQGDAQNQSATRPVQANSSDLFLPPAKRTRVDASVHQSGRQSGQRQVVSTDVQPPTPTPSTSERLAELANFAAQASELATLQHESPREPEGAGHTPPTENQSSRPRSLSSSSSDSAESFLGYIDYSVAPGSQSWFASARAPSASFLAAQEKAPTNIFYRNKLSFSHQLMVNDSPSFLATLDKLGHNDLFEMSLYEQINGPMAMGILAQYGQELLDLGFPREWLKETVTIKTALSPYQNIKSLEYIKLLIDFCVTQRITAASAKRLARALDSFRPLVDNQQAWSTLQMKPDDFVLLAESSSAEQRIDTLAILGPALVELGHQPASVVQLSLRKDGIEALRSALALPPSALLAPSASSQAAPAAVVSSRPSSIEQPIVEAEGGLQLMRANETDADRMRNRSMYIRWIAKDGTYGGEIEAVVAAYLYERGLEIFQNGHTNPVVLRSLPAQIKPPILLLYQPNSINPRASHYDAIKPSPSGNPTVIRVPGDGNCLFRSIATSLGLNDSLSSLNNRQFSSSNEHATQSRTEPSIHQSDIDWSNRELSLAREVRAAVVKAMSEPRYANMIDLHVVSLLADAQAMR